MGVFGSKEGPKPQFYDKFVEKAPSLEGKVVVITGTTSGTGYVMAKVSALKGAEVICLNRKSERSEKALKQLLEDVPGAKVSQIDCDLMNLSSVQAAAKQVTAKCSKGIDIVAWNAGVAFLESGPTDDGYDKVMQTNHLSHFLLTKELMTLLEKAAQTNGEARIVHMTSQSRKSPPKPLDAKHFGKVGKDDLGNNDVGLLVNGPMVVRYQQSKLANCVFHFGLKEKLSSKGSKVKTVLANPGLCVSPMSDKASNTLGLAGFFVPFVRQSVEDGALPFMHGMMSPGVESGDFLGPEKTLYGDVKKLDPEPLLMENIQLLWDESSKFAGNFDL